MKDKILIFCLYVAISSCLCLLAYHAQRICNEKQLQLDIAEEQYQELLFKYNQLANEKEQLSYDYDELFHDHEVLTEKYKQTLIDFDKESEKSSGLWKQVVEKEYEIVSLEEKLKESLVEEYEKSSLFITNAYDIEITFEDFYYLCKMAETEVGSGPVNAKMNVVSVALNRVKTGWGDTPKDVITSENQFAYFRDNISQNSITAVLSVLQYGDTTGGALYFHSSAYDVGYFVKYNAEYMFTDNVGHIFYK